MSLLFILYWLVAALVTLVTYRKEWALSVHDALIAGLGWIVIIPCWLLINLARYNFKQG